MIAYDMDGVICPEFEWIDDPNMTFEKIMRMTNTLRAIFQPKGPYIIITGRKETPGTMFWIANKLKVQPLAVHICLGRLPPAEYKAKILNENPSITLYVESEMEQVLYLREHTKTTILHIDELLPQV